MLGFKLTGLEAANKAIQARIDKLIVEAAADKTEKLLNELILATPIDTGYARSRWRMAPGDSPKLKYTVSYGTYFGIKVKPVSFEISNDAVYIEVLNQGHSKQAPSYFIEQTILSNGFTINNKIVN